MFLLKNLSNIFLQGLFRVAAAKPLKQLYQPHNFWDQRIE